MYLAELKGKLPSETAKREDILTSNVFSFFKYSNRNRYLRRLMSLIPIEASDKELDDAEFIFWPTYDDGTEPDLVILISNYYLLFEAKYLSVFGAETKDKKGQLIREFLSGLNEANSMRKELILVAVTADNCRPDSKFTAVPFEFGDRLRWMNWQSISRILLDLLEAPNRNAHEVQFARDLYNLLDKKKLRGFLSFDRLAGTYVGEPLDTVFFSAQSATFRGDFIGYAEALSAVPDVDKTDGRLFFSKTHFNKMPTLILEDRKRIFYKEGKCEKRTGQPNKECL